MNKRGYVTIELNIPKKVKHFVQKRTLTNLYFPDYVKNVAINGIIEDINTKLRHERQDHIVRLVKASLKNHLTRPYIDELELIKEHEEEEDPVKLKELRLKAEIERLKALDKVNEERRQIRHEAKATLKREKIEDWNRVKQAKQEEEKNRDMKQFKEAIKPMVKDSKSREDLFYIARIWLCNPDKHKNPIMNTWYSYLKEIVGSNEIPGLTESFLDGLVQEALTNQGFRHNLLKNGYPIPEQTRPISI